MNRLNPRLRRLKPEVLQALSEYYRETAEDCAAVERVKSGRAEARARAARHAAIIDAAGMVEAYAVGMGLEAAVRAVAQDFSLRHPPNRPTFQQCMESKHGFTGRTPNSRR